MYRARGQAVRVLIFLFLLVFCAGTGAKTDAEFGGILWADVLSVSAARAESGSDTGSDSGGQSDELDEPSLDDLFGVDESDQTDSEDGATDSGANDPLEGLNRVVYGFNKGLDALILKPVARLWRFLVPEPVDRVAHNFVSNWKLPVSALSSLLAADGTGAAVTTGRFLVNTTVGGFGLGDPATQMGLPLCEEDLGQTFGVWGVGEGAYVVLPLLGPSGVRDTTGTVGEFLLPDAQEESLEALKVKEDNREAVVWGTRGVDAVRTRAELLEFTDELEATSLDEYVRVRSFYRQNRAWRVEESCGDVWRAGRDNLLDSDSLNSDSQ